MFQYKIFCKKCNWYKKTKIYTDLIITREFPSLITKSFCKKSSDGKHVWVYPRLEDSIDRDRSKELSQVYCQKCYFPIKNSVKTFEAPRGHGMIFI